MSGSAECRNQPSKGKRAQRQLLSRPATRSPERARKTRAFLLTKTYIGAGDTSTNRLGSMSDSANQSDLPAIGNPKTWNRVLPARE
jgi:hypothetical protein